MIKSMTGFGRGEAVINSSYIFAEIKSVNSKSCNLITKLPDILSPFEPDIVNYVKNKIRRGQITVTIEIVNDELSSCNKVIIDHNLAKEYYSQLESLRDALSLTDKVNLTMLFSLPGIITIKEIREEADRVWSVAYQALVLAVDQFMCSRESEGSVMFIDINERIASIIEIIDRIRSRSHLVVDEYSQRLKKRLVELLQNQPIIDESRLAMEVAIIADKCDITEELVRLKSHIMQMRDNLTNLAESVGRQLDFILQEANREVNTISSKANDYQISSDCIQLKYEIEKIREQAQNIE